jgi:hypothetical protein
MIYLPSLEVQQEVGRRVREMEHRLLDGEELRDVLEQASFDNDPYAESSDSGQGGTATDRKS